MYFEVYSQLTTPAPAIPRQNSPRKPTPNTLFVPQCVLGVGFMFVLEYMGAGVVVEGVWVGVQREVLEGVQRVGDGSEGE